VVRARQEHRRGPQAEHRDARDARYALLGAKGSSGSPIVDDAGNVVGILHRATVTPGQYKGATQTNDDVFIEVLPSATIGSFHTNDIEELCSPPLRVYGPLDLTNLPHICRWVVSSDGELTGTVGAAPATGTFSLAGHFDGLIAAGTLAITLEFDFGGSHHTCSSGAKTWTAALQP